MPAAESPLGIVLVGGGGHALSLLQMLPPHITVLGYVDREPVAGMPIAYLGTDREFLDSGHAAPVHISMALGHGASLAARARLIDMYAACSHATLVAADAIVTPEAVIAPGCAVLHRAVVNGATLGPHCIINTGAIVEHGVTLGPNCFVGPGAVVCGGAEIGRNVTIGAGATVRNGVSICSGTVVGMGAAVTSSITTPGTYVGVPAKPLHRP